MGECAGEVKVPMPGEWWELGTRFRVYLIGRRLNGSFACEERSGKIDWFYVSGPCWTHLPDCDSFAWMPEVFPQYWTTLDGRASHPESTAFILRNSKTDWNLVKKNGEHGINLALTCDWKPEGRTQITKEQAEALLLQKPPRTITVIKWLVWDSAGHERILHQATKPVGYERCINVGSETFEVPVEE